MKLTVLAENNAVSPLEAEHGLSMLIEYNENKLFFDFGMSDIWRKNAEKLNAGKDFLNQHGIALNPEIAILEKKALFAQNRNDFEVANNIYLSAEKIISKQKIELSLKLKNNFFIYVYNTY